VDGSRNGIETVRRSIVSSVELRFLAVFIPAMFLVLVLLTGGYEWHNYSKSLDNLNRRINAVTANLSLVLAEPLAANDQRQVRLLLATVIADQAVTALQVTGAHGEIIDSFGDVGDVPDRWKSVHFVNFADGNQLRQVGSVTLAFSDDRLREAALERVGFAAISVGIMLLSAVLIVHWSYSRAVGQPISALQRALRETDGGKRSRVEWSSDDEIGDLVLSFNELQAREEHSLKMLQETQAELEKRVRERTQELELATSQAVIASRAKTEFLAAMSHEFRTPLNAILGFGDLLLEDSETMTSKRRREYLREMVNSGEILLSLVSKLLDFSRLETGNLEIAPEQISPSVEVQAAVKIEFPRAVVRKVEIDYQEDLATGSRILADPERFRQVVSNLIANAVKYNRPMGRVFITLDDSREGWCRLTVRDTGDGIAEDQRDKVFRPFDRLGREAGSIDGVGIGLALAKRLTESMGGRIDYSSVLGEGSTFWVEFPLLTLERDEPQTRATAA
jgi:signal transduction histidine kinase